MWGNGRGGRKRRVRGGRKDEGGEGKGGRRSWRVGGGRRWERVGAVNRTEGLIVKKWLARVRGGESLQRAGVNGRGEVGEDLMVGGEEWRKEYDFKSKGRDRGEKRGVVLGGRRREREGWVTKERRTIWEKRRKED